MTQPNRTEDREKKDTKTFSSTIFNLVALALLLAVIILLHNAYKKNARPVSKPDSEAVALNVTKEEKVVEKIKPAIVELSTDETVPVETRNYKEAKSQTKKKFRRNTSYGYQSGAEEVRELDSEQARLSYLEQNRHVSKGQAVPSTYQTTYTSSPPQLMDLDNESARLKYLEDNKRLSRQLASSNQPRQGTSNDYIPFER